MYKNNQIYKNAKEREIRTRINIYELHMPLLRVRRNVYSNRNFLLFDKES